MLSPEPYSLPRLSDNPRSRRNLVSLTPLIDVVFILLVFFMLASSFMDWRALELSVSSPSTGVQTEPVQPMVLTVAADELLLNGEAVARTQLVPLLREYISAHPEHVVRVQPQLETPLQAVVAVVDYLQAQGIGQLTLQRDSAWSLPSTAPIER